MKKHKEDWGWVVAALNMLGMIITYAITSVEMLTLTLVWVFLFVPVELFLIWVSKNAFRPVERPSQLDRDLHIIAEALRARPQTKKGETLGDKYRRITRYLP